MNNSEIIVSIILPTYKRPTYLQRAISSVLSQSYSNFELLIVDDNNEGDEYRKETESLISSFSDSRIKYIRHKKNKGGSAARNSGIKYSIGKYITFLDDDDEFEKDKILEQVQCMESLDENWVGSYTMFKRFKNGELFDKSCDCKSGYLYLDFFKNELYIYAGSNLFVKSEIAKAINGFDESFKRLQDLEFLIRVAEKGNIACIDKYLLKINLHEDQVRSNYKQLIEYTDHFFKKFDNQILKLENSDKKDVYTSKYLDLLKRILVEKDFEKAIILVKSQKIGFFLLIRYLFFLLTRKVFRKCYGFKF
ncbi:MAG: hypothetical protein PWR27_1130 [Petroclostridium sp.]|nr:hypothetical protein [Petroclostridium sp.]